MAYEFDQSTESCFWQAKALEVAEQIDWQWCRGYAKAKAKAQKQSRNARSRKI